MKPIKPREPKKLTLFLTAFSGIFLGAALGIWLLLTHNAVVVSSLPGDEDVSLPGDYTTLYTVGRVDGNESANLRSSSGRIKRRSPGPVSFSAGEVNYFFQNIGLAPAEGEEAPEQNTRMGKVNFYFDGDQVWASMKIVIDPEGSPFEALVLAKVSFDNLDAGPQLKVQDLRVNSLPIPDAFGLVSSMVESSIAATPWPEELVEMWQNIRKIEIESGKLITEVGLRRA